MSDPTLSIRDLRVDFPDVIAVDGLSLDIGPGDVCGLIGPNGSGKTTTMRAAVGMQRPTRGEVRIAGLDPFQGDPECRRLVGFMPDAPGIYGQLTVAEFLDHFARAYGVADRAQRIADCIRRTWLTEKTRALCQTLSRGMKQRLTLARTLLHDPPVMLLDEPASGIDPIGRIELRNLILALARDGKAILVSSHILTEMDQFCNRVAIMERGRLVRSGRIDDLLRQSADRRMLVRWRLPHEAAERVLRAAAAVRDLQLDGQAAQFQYAGDDEALDELLAELVRAGVRVCEWRRVDENLERILVESGARAVT